MKIVCEKCGHKFPHEAYCAPTKDNTVCAICGTDIKIGKFSIRDDRGYRERSKNISNSESGKRSRI